MLLYFFEIIPERLRPTVMLQELAKAAKPLDELRSAIGLPPFKIVNTVEGVVIEGGLPEIELEVRNADIGPERKSSQG
jgi:hypothetical protein